MGCVEHYAKTGKKRCVCDISDKPFLIKKITKDDWKYIRTSVKNCFPETKYFKSTSYHALCPVCGKMNFAFHTKKAKNSKVQLGGKRRQEKMRRLTEKFISKRKF
jgi:hypothetical protein